MKEESRNATGANQSSEKLLALMEVLSLEDAPVRLSDLADRMGMNISTVSRFLAALQKRGYVSQSEERGAYRMTCKICHLANNVVTRIDYRAVCRPYLKTISHTFGCTANLTARYEDSLIYLDVVPGPQQHLVPLQRIGKVAPLYCTGCGKLFLTRFSEEELADYAADAPFPRYTPHTLCTLAELREELQTIVRQGYAVDNEECELGTRCLAVPILNCTGDMQAAISINAPISRLTDSFLQESAPHLQAIALEISGQLGYRPQ